MIQRGVFSPARPRAASARFSQSVEEKEQWVSAMRPNDPARQESSQPEPLEKDVSAETALPSDDSAIEVIPGHEVITLSAKDSAAFIEALMNPPQPNEHLRAAFRAYRELIGE